MDKTLQDHVWQHCLPKEFKEEVKKRYKTACRHCDLYSARGMMETLELLFGKHNLTSDAEGEEMLMCEKSRVQQQYKRATQLKDDSDPKWEFVGNQIERVLIGLFGSKCLPDNVDSLEPAEPKFKPNDKVIFENVVCTITQVCYEDYTYALMKDKTGAFVAWISESDLEPYTEPILQPFSSVKETKASVETGDNLFEQHFAGTSIAAHGKTDYHIADVSKMMRLNIAAIVLQGFVSNPDWSTFKGKNNAELRQKMAKGALDFADALLTEAESSTEALCSAQKGGDK